MTTEMNTSSELMAIDAWVRHAFYGDEEANEISTLLRSEIPPLLTLLVRGGCSVQCQHCIFPFEGPKPQSAKIDSSWLHALLRQLPQDATLVHEGRQLVPWQVPVLKSIADAGYGISVINNGQYTTPAMLALIEREGLAVDTLDVSVDGTPATHNLQRSSQNNMAWTWAMKGISNARRFLKPTGKLTSLYTLTSLNYAEVEEVGLMLAPLIDEWHLTTMSLRPGIEHLRASKRELATALEQLFKLRLDKPVHLRTYSLEDFVCLMEILGKEWVEKSLRENEAEVQYNGLAFKLSEEIQLTYYPKSLQVNEAMVVDADNWLRLPFSVHYRLDELQAGVDQTGQDISHFSITPLSEGLDVASIYAKAATVWWKAIGSECLNAERAAVRQFLTGKKVGKDRARRSE